MKRFLLISAATLALTGCSTFEGLQQDVDGLFAKVDQKLQNDRATPDGQAMVTVAACPEVQVSEDLRHLAEFSDPDAPSDATKIAEVHIAGLEQACTYKDGHADMQINIAFDGETGPKARVKESDQANFSFPYFVAVTDGNDSVLAKEVFAANVSNGAGKDDINQMETIYQQLPFNEDGDLPEYQIVVGFQLTPEQLAYNRAGVETAAGLSDIISEPNNAESN